MIDGHEIVANPPGADDVAWGEEIGRPRIVYALSMDLQGSTAWGLTLPQRRFDRFNKALVRQLPPHVDRLGFDRLVIKFTGDGWLLLTDEEIDVERLCALALVMQCRMESELAELTGFPVSEIPPLRAAVCSGRDVEVTTPGGSDYVGDSARRSVRAERICPPGSVLVDATVLRIVGRDFDVTSFDAASSGVGDASTTSTSAREGEEKLALWVLNQIRPEAALDADAPDAYIYALDSCGRGDDADFLLRTARRRFVSSVDVAPDAWERLLASASDYTSTVETFSDLRSSVVRPSTVAYTIVLGRSPDYETALGWWDEMREVGVEPNVVTYNTLINLSPDYETALGWWDEMREVGVEPNVVTYTTLINLSPDYETALGWWDEMREVGVEPGLVTYNTLINLSPDYETALGWWDEMREVGVEPGLVTYNTLINLSPDYETALGWWDEMREVGVKPDIATYSATFSKELSRIEPGDLLSWFWDQRWHPPEALNAAIASYRRAGQLGNALLVALRYPHISSARRLFRDYGQESLDYLSAKLEDQTLRSDTVYALAVAYYELGETSEARAYALEALNLPAHEKRIKAIAELLRKLDN